MQRRLKANLDILGGEERSQNPTNVLASLVNPAFLKYVLPSMESYPMQQGRPNKPFDVLNVQHSVWKSPDGKIGLLFYKRYGCGFSSGTILSKSMSVSRQNKPFFGGWMVMRHPALSRAGHQRPRCGRNHIPGRIFGFFIFFLIAPLGHGIYSPEAGIIIGFDLDKVFDGRRGRTEDTGGSLQVENES